MRVRVLPVLTEPSSSCRPLSAPHVGDPWTWRWRAVSRTRGCRVHSAVPLGSQTQPGASRVPISRRPSALRRGGGGHSSMASGRCTRGAETVHSAVDHTQLGPSRPPHHQQQRQERGDGVGRRRHLSTTKTSAPPCRSPFSLWFQSQRGRGNWHTAWGAQLHKNCKHACATTAHVVHRSLDCTRDRERCTER